MKSFLDGLALVIISFIATSLVLFLLACLIYLAFNKPPIFCVMVGLVATLWACERLYPGSKNNIGPGPR